MGDNWQVVWPHRALGTRGVQAQPPLHPAGAWAMLALSLDHAGQPGWQEEAHGAQQADNDEDPEENTVDDHGHVLPVLLHLQTQTRGHSSLTLGLAGRKRTFWNLALCSHQAHTPAHMPVGGDK